MRIRVGRYVFVRYYRLVSIIACFPAKSNLYVTPAAYSSWLPWSMPSIDSRATWAFRSILSWEKLHKIGRTRGYVELDPSFRSTFSSKFHPPTPKAAGFFLVISGCYDSEIHFSVRSSSVKSKKMYPWVFKKENGWYNLLKGPFLSLSLA